MTVGEAEREGFAAFILRMRARGIDSKALFSAMEATPRASFVPAEWKNWVWSNRTLPIECGESFEPCDLQGAVLHALDLKPGLRVLEIGTGTGYTSAIIARIAERVLTLDRYKTLCKQAQQRHEACGLSNILVRQADGADGAADGPFDRIVVWAAFEELPRRFVDLLASGGIMVAPLGPGDDVQIMARFTKIGSRFERVDLEFVRLQPLIRGIAQAL